MTDQSISAELADVKNEVRVLRAMLVEIGVLSPGNVSVMEQSLSDRRRHGIGRSDLDDLPQEEAAIMLRAFLDMERVRAARQSRASRAA